MIHPALLRSHAYAADDASPLHGCYQFLTRALIGFWDSMLIGRHGITWLMLLDRTRLLLLACCCPGAVLAAERIILLSW